MQAYADLPMEEDVIICPAKVSIADPPAFSIGNHLHILLDA